MNKTTLEFVYYNSNTTQNKKGANMYKKNFNDPDFKNFRDMEALNKYLDELTPNMKNKVTRHFFNLSYYEYEKVIEFVRKQKRANKN